MRSRSLSIALFVLGAFTNHLLSAGTSGEVSFRLKQNKIVVRGSIGKCNRLNLAIDTGATTTAISEKLAGKLNLMKGRTEDAAVYGHRVRVQRALLPELSFGSVTFRDVPVLVTDLNLGLQFRLDALIGMELLKRQPLTIDYSSRQIRFGDVVHSDSFFPVNSLVPLIIFQMKVEGGRPLRLMLDTGAEDLILYRNQVEGKVKVAPSTVTKTFWSPGGRPVKLRRVFLFNIEMRDAVWESLPAFLLDVPEDRLGYLDGIVGAAVLELKTLSLDFHQGVVSWTR